MDQLLVTLLPLLIQYGPQLIKDGVDLIHGNPQLQDETDDAYIARLKTLTDANIQTTLDQDKQVES
jgi:hypothetical protein